MMGGTDDLVAALEALAAKENAAPSEIFKAFNGLLLSHAQDISGNFADVLGKFRPSTRIGRILRIRLVDRCRDHGEVLKLLQSGDSLDANQALKCRWFFAKLDDPENFVNRVLPTLSLSVRLKVVNKLASHLDSTTAGEGLYLALKSRYGLRDALPALASCGESFVRDELPNLNGVALPPALMLALLRKYPKLGTEYLAYLVDEERKPQGKIDRSPSFSSRYESSFRKLSETDLGSFIDIYIKNQPSMPYMSVGRRVTKACIRRYFELILSKYDICQRFLYNRRFYSHLSFEQSKAVLCCLLPPTLTGFFQLGEWSEPMQFFGDRKAPGAPVDLLREAFRSKYGKDPFPKYTLRFDDHWLDYLPPESRVEKVEARLKAAEGPREQARLLAYLPVDRAIPRLKKLIESQSDPDVRRSIAHQMVRSIKHNRRPDGLGDLFTYFNKRFRNETKEFREDLLTVVCQQFDIKFWLHLDKDDWAPFDELVELIRLNKEVFFAIWYTRELLQKQIHCYFVRNFEVEPLLQRYIDIYAESDNFEYFSLDMFENTPYQRTCVEWFLKKIPAMKLELSKKLPIYAAFMDQVVKLNRKNAPNPVVLPDEAIIEIEKLMKDSELHNNFYFNKMLDNVRGIPMLKDRLLRSAFPVYTTPVVLNRLLKLDPGLVRDELEGVLKVVLGKNFRKYRSFYAKSRLYESYGIPQKLSRVCRVSLKLETDDSVDEDSPILEQAAQRHAVQVLALVLDPSEYAELASKYAPEKGTIEEYSDEVTAKFALQKAVCRSFVGVSNPSTLLPLLPKFTVGDYLKIAVGSLTFVCSRLPEVDVLPVLEKWTDCPVSLRKHVLRLMYRMAPAAQSMAAFVEFFKKEKNSSLRRVIFLEIRKTFAEVPSNETFEALSSVIKLLTDEDEALKDLFCVDFVSPAYISRYLEFLWRTIQPEWESLPNGKTNIINSIDKHVVEKLDDKFCEELLSHVLGTLPDPLPPFVYSCLFYGRSLEAQLARLKAVAAALAPFADKWNQRQTEPGRVFKVRRTVRDFVDGLCQAARDCEDKPGAARILSEAKKALGEMSPLRESLRTFYQLDVNILFLNLDAKTSFESALAALFTAYAAKYENAPHSLFAALSEPIPMLSSRTKLAHELVQTDLPICQVLAAQMAEKSIESDEELLLFNKIIEILSTSEHPDVQNAAAQFFENLESQLIE